MAENPWLEPFYSGADGMRTYALPLQLHFLATPLGYQRTYGRQEVVATLLTFNEATLDVVRARRGHHAPVLRMGAPEVYSWKQAS